MGRIRVSNLSSSSRSTWRNSASTSFRLVAVFFFGGVLVRQTKLLLRPSSSHLFCMLGLPLLIEDQLVQGLEGSSHVSGELYPGNVVHFTTKPDSLKVR